jgi:hypothetical protein
MKSFIGILFNFSFLLQCHGQVAHAPQNISRQASKMGTAFVKKDYVTFANYIYPLILKSMGGQAKMADVLKKSIDDMESQGMSITSITFAEPSAILKSGKELQAAIAQHTEIKLQKGRLVSTSTLIAVSSDNGTDWKFIDTSNKDLATLRKALPNLSSAMVIPPQQAPLRYND